MAWTGCQKEDDFNKDEPVPADIPEGSFWLSLEASKDAGTKALYLDGSTLNAYWKAGESVQVFKSGSSTSIGELAATPGAGEKPLSATLSGTITGSLAANDELTLLFPRETWDYTGQDGSAPSEAGSLATKYDYATATVAVNSVDGNAVSTTTTAQFRNEQSIYRFAFKVGGSSDAINVRSFTVSSVNNALVRSRSWNGSSWSDNLGSIQVSGSSSSPMLYAALRSNRVGTSDDTDTYSFDVIDSNYILYLGGMDIPAGVMDVQGKFISAQNISVTKATMNPNPTNTTEVW